MVVWVIYSQVEPYVGVGGNEVMAAIRADPTARHDIPTWTDKVAAGVITQCWAVEAADRPSFEDIRKVLSGWFTGGEVGGAAEDVYLDL